MTGQLKLTRDDEWFLEKAYLAKPKGRASLVSLSIFDDDIDAHDAFDSNVYPRLVKLGYIVSVEDRTWVVGTRSVDVLIFRLTPLGMGIAERLIDQRRGYSIGERFASVSRSDWIALVALVVSVIALFQAFL